MFRCSIGSGSLNLLIWFFLFSWKQLELIFPVSDIARDDTTDRMSDQVTSQEIVWVSPHGKVVVIPKLQLPDGIHLNQDTPSKWSLSWPNKSKNIPVSVLDDPCMSLENKGRPIILSFFFIALGIQLILMRKESSWMGMRSR